MKTPPISIEALVVLDAIAERGSYAAAAEALDKVPSALSYIVQKIEEQLNVTLFQRQGRRSVLTPAGKHLLAEGRNLLMAINKISEQTQVIANGWEPRIRIDINAIIDSRVIFPSLALFLEEHPNIELDICEEVLNGSWEALIEDEVDLLIGAPDPVPTQKGIRTELICMLNTVFCVGATHELAKTKLPMKTTELAQYRTIVVHDTVKKAIPWSKHIIQNSQHIYVANVEQKIQATLAGIGGCFLPKKRIQHYLDSGELVEIKVSDKTPPNELHIAWKVVNRGKGLQRLCEILTTANLSDVI